MPLNRFRTLLLVGTLVMLLLLPLWIVRYPPLLDYPDHLARSFIIFHLDDPAYRFRNVYSTEWGPYPYLGMDVLLIGLQHLLSAEAAGRLLLSVCVLLLPMAGWWFLREANPGHDALSIWVCNDYDYIWTYGTEYYSDRLLTFANEIYRAGRLHLCRVHRMGNESACPT
jgi:hypothetical protein